NSVNARRVLDAVLMTYGYVTLFVMIGLLFGTCLCCCDLTRMSALWTPQVFSLLLGIYSLCCLVFAAHCFNLAVHKLRPASLKATRTGSRPLPHRTHSRSRLPPARRWLPPVFDHALLWKEMYFDQRFPRERVHPSTAILLLSIGGYFGLTGLTAILLELG